MKSNRIASIIIESNRIVRSVNRSGPSLWWGGGGVAGFRPYCKTIDQM